MAGTATADKHAQRWHDTSIHEAGHAVIGAIADLPIQEVRLRRTLFGHVKGRTEVRGGTVLGTADQDLVFTMGGPEAEAIWYSHRTGKSLPGARRRMNCGSDRANIASCLREPDLTLTHGSALEWVHSTLLEQWARIEMLADALCEYGRLTGRDLARLL